MTGRKESAISNLKALCSRVWSRRSTTKLQERRHKPDQGELFFNRFRGHRHFPQSRRGLCHNSYTRYSGVTNVELLLIPVTRIILIFLLLVVLVQIQILSYIVDDVPCICSQRWILAYITFFGYLLVYVFRNSFSVVLICTTKDNNVYATNNNSNYSNFTQGDCIEDIQEHINNELMNAEFDLDKTIRSGMLTAFFYSYIITQIPGGWLADRFVMLISSISLLILPVCARTTYILVYAIRAVLGIASVDTFLFQRMNHDCNIFVKVILNCSLLKGMVSPSVTSMWGRWAPPLERSRLTTLPNVEGLTLIWLVAWAFLTTDSPDNHPRIKEDERNYIVSNIGFTSFKKSSFSVSWRQVFTSRPVWACIIGHV
ncbi:hypothetical protein KUTeg_002155 [Tegillarca granosa]|uniref:Uncharacterized protein n=1 Tax=Tegillarca granosa TaxID=220873 RepID=A0ABQ9FTI4_TEGGR|nr:hypothetical protein KUTeg_002155 [Tegillarca granosa]